MKLALILLAGLAPCSCSKPSPVVVQPAATQASQSNDTAGPNEASITEATVELTRRPTALTERTLNTGRLTYHGVKLGDAAAAIPQALVTPIDAAGGLTLKTKEGGYLLRDGRVREIWLHQTLPSLGIAAARDVETQLGKADQVSTVEPLIIYSYTKRHLKIVADKTSAKCTVTISD